MSEDAIAKARKDVDVGLEKNKGLLGIPSAMEETANAIKASTITTVINTLGLDVKKSGDSLVGAIRGIGDRFGGDKGLIEGIGVGGVITIAGLSALSLAIPLLTAAVSALTIKMTLGAFGGGLGGGDVSGSKNSKTKPAKVRGRFGKIGKIAGAVAGAGGFLWDKMRSPKFSC